MAGLLREKNMDISVAHVIEAVRLAQASAALRGLSSPSLAEYNEAVVAVMGFGDDILLRLIGESMVVGDRLGHVPDAVPKVPLLIDVERQQKRLRVPFTAEIKELTLDLRKPNDLERSLFFHRLSLLGIDWATLGVAEGKGTFKERWTLYHKPEHIVCIIERAIWGNTLHEAVQKYLLHRMEDIRYMPELTHLLNLVIPADLPDVVGAMTTRLDGLSAGSTDIVEMLEAVPDLVGIVRYGNVRNLDFSQVANMLQAMIARILAGGLLVCINIDEDAASDLLEHLAATDYAVATLNDSELSSMWCEFLGKVGSASNVHPLLSGYATRLLHDKGLVSHERMHDALRFYSSVGNATADIAYWFEGFLRSSGSLLLLDDHLWELVNGWVCDLSDADFKELLPIIRRTFSLFTSVERRKLGEKARGYEENGKALSVSVGTSCNDAEAQKVLPLVCSLLGLEIK